MSDDALALQSTEVDLAQWADIAYAIAGGLEYEEAEVEEQEQLATHEWIAKKWDITPREAIGILAHPKFASFLHSMQTSLARADFDIFAYNRLMNIIKWGDDKAAIAASKELASMIGYRKDGPTVEVNFNIDSIVNGMTKDPGDKGPVIDVEYEDYPGL